MDDTRAEGWVVEEQVQVHVQNGRFQPTI
jgi:hypothetical protein